jgi:predicted glycoside hydrolase/deacetylase ChbG (UPF0249 family)
MDKSRKKFILSADDFGISPLANKNVLALVKARKLDRISLMTEGAFTPKELEKLAQSGVKIDLHLEAGSKKKHKKEVKESALLRALAFSMKLLSKKMRSDSVEAHWEGQIEKFYALVGKYPDGLNSHQHIHFFPPYFRLLIKLAKKYGIHYIRFGQYSIIKSNTHVYRILAWLHKKDSRAFHSSELRSSDHLISLDWIKKMEKFLDQKPTGTIEIVCHPERKKEFEMIKKYF